MIFQAEIKGFFGELRTNLSQALFLDSSQYHCYNNVVIPAPGGTTQIDEIVVSRYGIFVVETKNKSGWIFGSRDTDKWTQTLGGKKYQFQNPLRQNYRHTKSLAEFFQIDHTKFHSVIVFWGDCKFKTSMPENVLNNNYTGYIKSKNAIILTDEEIEKINNQLTLLKKYTPADTNRIHRKDLKSRFESTTVCPKCNGLLVERSVKNGPNSGEKFLGCENFPRCRFTKPVR